MGISHRVGHKASPDTSGVDAEDAESEGWTTWNNLGVSLAYEKIKNWVELSIKTATTKDTEILHQFAED